MAERSLNLPTQARRLKRLLGVLVVLGVYVGLTAVLARRYLEVPQGGDRRCELRGGWLYRDGEKFLVKGVGYDPSRPGELPWARRRSVALLESDLARIRAAGFNTIRTWETLSRDELAATERQGLAVIQGIWIDPEGDFADAAFRRRAVEKVENLVRETRRSNAVIAYLVMNEPRPAEALKAGEEVTRSFLKELAATVRDLDPEVPVTFASWPGAEFLDDPAFPLVAANLHPFRPRALLEALGYQGMVRLWKQMAGERALLVTEYGVSVSPVEPGPDAPGGATEEEQEEALPRLAESIVRAGAAGGCLFMWIDGWWKNDDRPGDEMLHDLDDGEEWFGLNAMESIDDRLGRARPALEAMRAWNRAVLTLPADGAIASREVEVEAWVEDGGEVVVEASINGSEPVLVPVVREGPWIRGRLGLLSRAEGPQRIRFVISSGEDTLARTERIVVPPGQGPTLHLSAPGEGEERVVIARVRDGKGRPLAGVSVRFAVTESSRRFDRTVERTTDAQGEARLPVKMPPSPAVLLVAAGLRSRPEDPPLALVALLLRSGG